MLAAEPIINEFLRQNNTINKDEDGDASDWVEIYNPNTTSISLNGYFLTDNRAKLTKWKFPNVSLNGQGYMLVWASNKNRVDPTKPLHTNFSLDKDGEYLGLIKPDGVTIDSEFAPYFRRSADISYGIRPDTGDLDFLKPTPVLPNSNQGIVADTKFDHDRGYDSAPFDVAITTDTIGASIRYTTDDSVPTATVGTLYAGPVHISTTAVLCNRVQIRLHLDRRRCTDLHLRHRCDRSARQCSGISDTRSAREQRRHDPAAGLRDGSEHRE